MKVICIEEQAFYELIDQVVDRVKQSFVKERKWIWIDGNEAMKLLNISSKTTLQKLRNEGKIRFSQPTERLILYDINSIHNYLENYAKETF